MTAAKLIAEYFTKAELKIDLSRYIFISVEETTYTYWKTCTKKFFKMN